MSRHLIAKFHRGAGKPKPSDLHCKGAGCGAVLPGGNDYDDSDGSYECPNCGAGMEYRLKDFPTGDLVSDYFDAEDDMGYGGSLLEELHGRAENNDREAAAAVLNDIDMFDYGTEDDDPMEVMRNALDGKLPEPKGYNPHWTYQTGRQWGDPPAVLDPFEEH